MRALIFVQCQLGDHIQIYLSFKTSKEFLFQTHTHAYSFFLQSHRAYLCLFTELSHSFWRARIICHGYQFIKMPVCQNTWSHINGFHFHAYTFSCKCFECSIVYHVFSNDNKRLHCVFSLIFSKCQHLDKSTMGRLEQGLIFRKLML